MEIYKKRDMNKYGHEDFRSAVNQDKSICYVTTVP